MVLVVEGLFGLQVDGVVGKLVVILFVGCVKVFGVEDSELVYGFFLVFGGLFIIGGDVL